ncbi:MAG: nicotinamide-nucleotide adenylyltransferase [Candidatus Woesearchaeota archaeon]|jgi:nicotinamide-nucleotide adenylyltransferase|nr:nicotinamide-nucleotide adenylyltransferase [Candidatus Woesearchaeota archaeon]MDP7506098.1 nicotinamide-nucleotide adenylyltransferase [Candidatus Woesearchaeota archaeon]MDP7610414.1 nicotinamide-nucleotide adenylyltransferase [Candidatus Woesearchaeota archaeon]|tara:strand:- start:652 stop:1110 length:459 start_codon:yes stop_codon:yes gene_type:complete
MVIALFIGRFQPFHKGHLSAIRQILRKVDKIVICVGSSKKAGVKGNPFTFEERFKMIEETLVSLDIGGYTIFPIPDVPNDKKWVEHVKVLVPKFDVVYSSNPLVIRLFKEKGVEVKKVKMLEGVSSTKVRKLLNSKGWEKLVPKEVVRLVKK